MEYVEFDAARRRVLRSWGRELVEPETLAAAVERLRADAETIQDDAERAKARRYLTTLDNLVVDARTPESESLRAASDVLLRALAPGGTPAERRVRAETAIAEINRIAQTAPTPAGGAAVLELNESLAEIIELETEV
ncbi:hypothetical protein PWY87_13290 [Kribbella solani]|uniref:hypothetical protein n=1 Tax=Kribbella solani TaxID=236067 RepID=UPI0029AA4631|nr:hypothetical protein [Kribbella solani]MDX2968866.1 hypothetical protein [Kribbella solani]MDX3002655.1 hypothetical protein [Kribbella solani]